MRQRLIVIAAVFGLVGLSAGGLQAGKAELKGIHLCCPMCVKAVGETLKKVDGVSDIKCDEKAKTVTFTTKDVNVTVNAAFALEQAGFFPDSVKDDGKSLVAGRVGEPKPGDKADDVTIKGVHVCCKMCETEINDLFKNAKVSYSGKETTKDVKISGKDLEKAKVLETLRKAGFTGKVQK